MMKFFEFKHLFTFLLLITSIIAQTQENRDANAVEDALKDGYSDLWGENGKNWTPTSRLPDFSFAGYDMGDSQIPNFPIRARLGDDGSQPDDDLDDSDELQRLIDSIERPGMIVIPKGVWNIDKRISIEKSSLIIRGEDGAEFKMNKSLRQLDAEPDGTRKYAFTDAYFIVEGKIRGGDKKRITTNVAKGAIELIIESGEVYQPGDLVEINLTESDDQSLFLLMNGTDQKRDLWHDFNESCATDNILNRVNLLRFFSKVIKQEGNTVTLARTLPIQIDTKWTPTIHRVDLDNSFHNFGFENLRIRMNGDPFKGHFTIDGSSAFLIRNVLNSWIRNVEIIDADNAINAWNTFNTLFDSIRFTVDKRSDDRTGHHAIWFRQSSDNLITDCDFSTKYFHDMSVELQSRQNVFSRCSGVDVNLDHHRGTPFANVFTEIDAGAGTRLHQSGGSGCRGPHTGAFTTFWNIVKSGGGFGEFPYKSGGSSPLKALPKDYNYAHSVGLLGTHLSAKSESFGQFIEFSNGEILKTPNIYLAQLVKRRESEGEVTNNHQLDQRQLSVYPNPTNGIVYIESAQHWELYNLLGSKIKSGLSTQIDISNFTKGIYWLKVEKKIVKLIHH